MAMQATSRMGVTVAKKPPSLNARSDLGRAPRAAGYRAHPSRPGSPAMKRSACAGTRGVSTGVKRRYSRKKLVTAQVLTS